MKKRLRRKLEKQQALAEFADMLQHCDECGAKYVVKDREMTVTEEFFGTFTLRGFHPVCPNGCEDVYTSKLARDERCIKKARIQEMLLKNYPPEKCEYFDINTLAELEKKSIPELLERDEFYFPIFFLDRDRKRLYLKKSYELYKKYGFNGWFDISVPESEKGEVEERSGITKVQIIVE